LLNKVLIQTSTTIPKVFIVDLIPFFKCLGQILLSIGAFYDSFPLMQFSRFVFGMGGESLSVAQNTYASAWFSGDALNMVFGLQVGTQ
jgi:hypothetical protein